jgi:hypothetical protein
MVERSFSVVTLRCTITYEGLTNVLLNRPRGKLKFSGSFLCRWGGHILKHLLYTKRSGKMKMKQILAVILISATLNLNRVI